MTKEIISSILLGFGFGGLGGIIGTIWDAKIGLILGTTYGTFIAVGILIIKHELYDLLEIKK